MGIAKLLLTCILLTGGEVPSAAHIESPRYPPLARQAGIEGDVRVNVTIDSHGKVILAKAYSGPPMMRSDVERNISSWTFTRSADSQQPIETEIVYQFRLEGKPSDDLPQKITFDLPGRVTVVSHPPLTFIDTTTATTKKTKEHN